MNKLLILTFLIPVTCFSQIKFRKYKPGEVFRYRLTSEVYRNDKFAGKTISIAQQKVVQDTGYLSEEVSWLSKMSFTPKDSINLDSIARSVKPYRISLSPKGKVLLPKLTIPQMVGDITDLNTFFVAVAPALNIQKLTTANPVIKNAEPRHGNFADSIVILYGTDCIEVTQSLLKTTKKYSTVKTDFTPPLSSCISSLLDTISIKIFDYPNNFQMIQKGTGDKVNLFWGIESFTITTKIDNKSGQILEATMTNTLNLKMRYNSSQDLKNYAVEMPITINRNLKLELLKE
jgi:hypothetical protein